MSSSTDQVDQADQVDAPTTREREEAEAIEAFVLLLKEEPSALQRAFGHMTGRAMELANQLASVIQGELRGGADRLAAFEELRPLIMLMLQMQRQAERNQQFVAKLAANGPGASAA